MGKYIVMWDNGFCTFPVKITSDRVEAFKVCVSLNEQHNYDVRYFVVRDSDGQTWEYMNGGLYRVVYYPDIEELEFKEVAI